MTDERSLKLLSDACDAGAAISRFAEGLSYDDYLGNELTRSAIERKFITIGEALTQLIKINPGMSRHIPDIERIRGFRNRLIHEYLDVNDDVVWSAAQHSLPSLMTRLRDLIAKLSDRQEG